MCRIRQITVDIKIVIANITNNTIFDGVDDDDDDSGDGSRNNRNSI